VRLLPVLFFFVAAGISGVGPGAISAVALVAPLAMSIGGPAGVPPLVMALVVANGANAANLSPVSAVGIIANTKMSEAGLAGHEGAVFAATFAASLLVALAGVLLFGRRAAAPPGGEPALAAARRLEPAQRLTVGVMALWMIGALVWQLPVGLSALAAAVVLMLARAGDERGVIARVPWSVVLMVSGVSMLVAVVETAGGLRLFTAALAALATPGTVNGVVALVTGGISLWSSTSGVVLPAFLPLAPGLVASVGGGDPVAVSISMTVGSSLVDVSPLSTLGALCITAAGDRDPGGRLFRQLLLWGVAMAFAGALYCQAVAGAIARL
jgi:di/tricarboxylate transporter